MLVALGVMCFFIGCLSLSYMRCRLSENDPQNKWRTLAREFQSIKTYAKTAKNNRFPIWPLCTGIAGFPMAILFFVIGVASRTALPDQEIVSRSTFNALWAVLAVLSLPTHYVVRRRLKGAGIALSSPFRFDEDLYYAEVYLKLAKSRGWSKWPIIIEILTLFGVSALFGLSLSIRP